MESLADIIIDDFVAQYDYWNEDYRNSNADSDVTDYYSYELALIDTAAAHEVIPELSEMFTVADQELYDSRLTDFLTAREKCGDFSGTYSADIVEFCTNYGVDGYEDVIAAVDTAVVTVESNISYANGLSFYIPEASEDGCVYYSYDGRINLENLDFDQECIKFYDDVLSAYAGYAYVDDISELGMESYYNEALVDAYSDTYVAYADATDFNMDYTYENGKYILDLGEDFEYVSFLEQRVGFDYKENNALVLGSDFNVLSWDDTGKVDITFPDKWLYVDGQIVCYVVTDHVTNTDGSVTMTGVIPFIFTEDNSRIYGIVIQWGSDRGVTVKGYTEIDTTDLSLVDGYMYSLYDGMEITFCYALVTHDGNQVDEDSTVFVTMGDSHTYDKSGFSITYGDINQVYDLLGTYGENAKGYSYVKVYDLFDNANITDLVPQN
jgi:hypothetical protein